jgi:phosphatidylglycerophosphate synthase
MSDILMDKIKENRKYVDIICEFFYSSIIERTAYVLYKFRATPNVITLISFLFIIAASVLLIITEQFTWITGIIYFSLVQMSFILDCCDGTVARLMNRGSNFGGWFDAVTDRIGEAVLFFAIAYTYFNMSNNISIMILVFFTVSIHLIECYASLFYSYYAKGNGVIVKEKIRKKSAMHNIIWIIKKYNIGFLLKGITISTILLSIIPIFNNIYLVYLFFIYYLFVNLISLLLKTWLFWKQGIE